MTFKALHKCIQDTGNEWQMKVQNSESGKNCLMAEWQKIKYLCKRDMYSGKIINKNAIVKQIFKRS